MRNLLRLVILILLIVAGLMYLNSAFFHAWVSGGPPNDYPEAHLQQAVRHFYYFVALASSGIMAFIALRKGFEFKKSKFKYIWVALLLLSFCYPELRDFLLIDKCLDLGGAWDERLFRCNQ